MLFEGDRFLIIARGSSLLRPRSTSRAAGPVPVDRSIFPSGNPFTILYHVSVAGPIPKLLATLRIEGSYVSAREVDGVARIVTIATPARQIRFVSARGSKLTEKEAKQRNMAIIRDTKSSDWLPRFNLKERSGAEQGGFISPCDAVFRPKGAFSGFTLLTVTTVRLAGPLTPRNGVSVASDGDTVYATADTLYVATTVYRNDFLGGEGRPESGQLFKTALHKFALSNAGQTYVASGQVSGSVLNQFSMHEYNGQFFVATTEGAPWWRRRDTSVSMVTAFRTSAAKRTLEKVGSVGNLGRGEHIFAVRYIGATAYVVTFEQIDPLYIIDLSTLKATGELKIPGFSSYLHVIAPGRLLGVGQEATRQGRTTGAKVTLFDVSDANNPRQLSKWLLKGGFSNVEWDHRAFLYWEPESVAVLPVSAGVGKKTFSGSVVLEISDRRIVERGRVTHPKCCGKYAFQPAISRNLVLGRTHLWSVSQELLQINSITDLSLESSVRLVLKPRRS